MLIGATSPGPAGGEVLGALAVAVHAQVPVAMLSQMIYAYPTFHRAIEVAVIQLSVPQAVNSRLFVSLHAERVVRSSVLIRPGTETAAQRAVRNRRLATPTGKPGRTARGNARPKGHRFP
jgi:hypothetical protein